MARDAFHLEVQNCGMACQPSQSRLPPCKVSKKLSKTVFFYLDLRFVLFNVIVNRF